jgi:hypothetical protein
MIDSNKMEIAFSAILGEITHRSISFVLDKLSKEKDTASLPLPFDEHLRHKLLRVVSSSRKQKGGRSGIKPCYSS